MQPVTLVFRREQGCWVAVYDSLPVEVCGRCGCQQCNLEERDRLRISGSQRLDLEVDLRLFRTPSFFKEKLFYKAHLVSISKKSQTGKQSLSTRAYYQQGAQRGTAPTAEPVVLRIGRQAPPEISLRFGPYPRELTVKLSFCSCAELAYGRETKDPWAKVLYDGRPLLLEVYYDHERTLEESINV